MDINSGHSVNLAFLHTCGMWALWVAKVNCIELFLRWIYKTKHTCWRKHPFTTVLLQPSCISWKMCCSLQVDFEWEVEQDRLRSLLIYSMLLQMGFIFWLWYLRMDYCPTKWHNLFHLATTPSPLSWPCIGTASLRLSTKGGRGFRNKISLLSCC